MRILAYFSMALLAALSANATTLSDNLSATTFGTELIGGSTWVTAGLRTGTSSYTLSSATFLIKQDSPGAVNVGLYSDSVMQPANDLGHQPGTLLGNLTPIGSPPQSLTAMNFSGNHLLLAANSIYWLVMSAPQRGSYEWCYESGNNGSGTAFYPSWGETSDSGNSWFTDNLQPMQMRVVGMQVSTTPEPSDAWLVIVGTLGMAGAITRLRTKAGSVADNG